ncbi:hypothetical protein TVAG_321550 [Trichomonas vaginalis G3]|uniref:Uncharacterized protein n=1 Tax=Trichomonas vaginalis (strain ATCC PRA-98 / G3) TaxID=412133 RepID=A2FXX9_TRIV3|nr:hypothetical protein TVAGG3_0405190 [Trichomonas vaginalis G3]EAX90234.1 hypothetical protein TVAG_321550 [Trichomonas vaginalis G3]KAI5534981.1 hypothetical protein TVAGG3_0405190 [Trichomonas vaginalis G3]|eukprot:XP_001303164.1 hypothetical protein [Trichomonas vaginalis G3]
MNVIYKKINDHKRSQMLPSARKAGKKRQQDTLCKLLAETKYQVFNITNAANTFYDTGNRVLFRTVWIKFARMITTQYNIQNTRRLAELSRAYDTIFESRLRKATYFWRYRMKWKVMIREAIIQDIKTQIEFGIPEIQQERREERAEKWNKFANALLRNDRNDKLIDAANENANEKLLKNSFEDWKAALQKRRTVRQARRTKWMSLCDAYNHFVQMEVFNQIVNRRTRNEKWIDFANRIAHKQLIDDLTTEYNRLKLSNMFYNMAVDYLYKKQKDTIIAEHSRFVNKRLWKGLIRETIALAHSNSLKQAKNRLDLADKFSKLAAGVLRASSIAACNAEKEKLDNKYADQRKEELVKSCFYYWRDKQIPRTFTTNQLQSIFENFMKLYEETTQNNAARTIQDFWREQSDRIERKHNLIRVYFTKWLNKQQNLVRNSIVFPPMTLKLQQGINYDVANFQNVPDLSHFESLDLMDFFKETAIEKKVASAAQNAVDIIQIKDFNPTKYIDDRMPHLFDISPESCFISSKNEQNLKFANYLVYNVNFPDEKPLTVLSENVNKNSLSFDGLELVEKPKVSEDFIEEIAEEAAYSSQKFENNFVEKSEKLNLMSNLRKVSEIDQLNSYDKNDIFDLSKVFDLHSLQFTKSDKLLDTFGKIDFEYNVEDVEDVVDDIDFTQIVPLFNTPVSRKLQCIPCFSKSEDLEQTIDENELADLVREKFDLEIYVKEASQMTKETNDYILRLEKEPIIVYDKTIESAVTNYLDLDLVYDFLEFSKVEPIENVTEVGDLIDMNVEIDENRLENEILKVISSDTFKFDVKPIENIKQIEELKQKEDIPHYDINFDFDDIYHEKNAFYYLTSNDNLSLDIMGVDKLISKEFSVDWPFLLVPYYKLIKNFAPPEIIETKYDVKFQPKSDFSNFEKSDIEKPLDNLQTIGSLDYLIQAILNEKQKDPNNVAIDVNFDLQNVMKTNISSLNSYIREEIPSEEEQISKVVSPQFCNQNINIDFTKLFTSLINICSISVPENINIPFDFDFNFEKLKLFDNNLQNVTKIEIPQNQNEIKELSKSYLVDFPVVPFNINLSNLYRFCIVNQDTLLCSFSIPLDILDKFVCINDFTSKLENISKISIPIKDFNENCIESDELQLNFNIDVESLKYITFNEPLPERDIMMKDLPLEGVIEDVVNNVFEHFVLPELRVDEGIDILSVISDDLDEAFYESVSYAIKQTENDKDEEEYDEEANDISKRMFDQLSKEILSKLEEKQEENYRDDFKDLIDEAHENAVTFALKQISNDQEPEEEENDEIIDSMFADVYKEFTTKKFEEEIDISPISRDLDEAFKTSITFALKPEEKEEQREEEKISLEELEKSLDKQVAICVIKLVLRNHKALGALSDGLEQPLPFERVESEQQPPNNFEIEEDFDSVISSVVNKCIETNEEAIEQLSRSLPDTIAKQEDQQPLVDPKKTYFSNLFNEIITQIAAGSVEEIFNSIDVLDYKPKKEKSTHASRRSSKAKAPHKEEEINIDEIKESLDKVVAETSQNSVQKHFEIEFPSFEDEDKSKAKGETISFEPNDFVGLLDSCLSKSIEKALKIDIEFGENETKEEIEEEEEAPNVESVQRSRDIDFGEEQQVTEEKKIEFTNNDFDKLFDDALVKSVNFATEKVKEIEIIPSEEVKEEEQGDKGIDIEKDLQNAIEEVEKSAIKSTFEAISSLSELIPEQKEEKAEGYDLFKDFDEEIKKSSENAVIKNFESISELFYQIPDYQEKPVEEKPEEKEEFSVNKEVVPFIMNSIDETVVCTSSEICHRQIDSLYDMYYTIKPKKEKTHHHKSEKPVSEKKPEEIPQENNTKAEEEKPDYEFDKAIEDVVSQSVQSAISREYCSIIDEEKEEKPAKEEVKEPEVEIDFDKTIEEFVQESVCKLFEIEFCFNGEPEQEKKETPLDVSKEISQLLDNTLSKSIQYSLERCKELDTVVEETPEEEENEEFEDKEESSESSEIDETEISQKMFDDVCKSLIETKLEEKPEEIDVIPEYSKLFDESLSKSIVFALKPKEEEINVIPDISKLLDNAFKTSIAYAAVPHNEVKPPKKENKPISPQGSPRSKSIKLTELNVSFDHVLHDLLQTFIQSEVTAINDLIDDYIASSGTEVPESPLKQAYSIDKFFRDVSRPGFEPPGMDRAKVLEQLYDFIENEFDQIICTSSLSAINQTQEGINEMIHNLKDKSTEKHHSHHHKDKATKEKPSKKSVEPPKSENNLAPKPRNSNAPKYDLSQLSKSIDESIEDVSKPIVPDILTRDYNMTSERDDSKENISRNLKPRTVESIEEETPDHMNEIRKSLDRAIEDVSKNCVESNLDISL